MDSFYATSFKTFFKIGMFTLGGGYAMIPIIEHEVVDRYHWIDRQEFVDIVAVAQSCPGVMAINMSTFIGYKMAKTRGALVTTLATALPSFIIILIVARCYIRFKNSALVKGCMSGLRPAVVGLIAAALVSVAQTVFLPQGFSRDIFLSPDFYVSLGIFAVMAFLAFKKLHPIIIICLSAAIGIGAGYILGITL